MYFEVMMKKYPLFKKDRVSLDRSAWDRNSQSSVCLSSARTQGEHRHSWQYTNLSLSNWKSGFIPNWRVSRLYPELHLTLLPKRRSAGICSVPGTLTKECQGQLVLLVITQYSFSPVLCRTVFADWLCEQC